MRITFFGSSHGVPDPNRKCSCALIEVGEARYFMDMGTQAIEQLVTKGIPVESIKAVFVTHMHGDHTNGLISFADLCTWYYANSNPQFYLPGKTEQTKEAMKAWLACNGQEMRDFTFGHVDDGFVYQDAYIKISAFRTQHIDQSFCYVLEAEGKRVFFSGDVKTPPTQDLPLAEFDKGFDLAIMECAHFWADEKYLPIFKGRTNIKKICINHFSEFRQASMYRFREQLPEIPVEFAYDGMEFLV